jgi:hypothetical protein
MIGQLLRARVVGPIAVVLASGGLVLSLAACGGAEAKAPDAMKVGAPPPEREPSSIEEAQQHIANAKAELAGGAGADGTSDNFARRPPGVSADSPKPAESSPTTPPSRFPSQSPVQRPSTSTESAPAKAGQDADDHCGSPCRALTSMRRAVTALCRMTGTEDARCLDAKHTLAESESRIAPCSC